MHVIFMFFPFPHRFSLSPPFSENNNISPYWLGFSFCGTQ